ncbi:MAG: glycosyl hydrolase family 28-related protein [Thermoguttaceae bacterium]|jgi:hypothetical protein
MINSTKKLLSCVAFAALTCVAFPCFGSNLPEEDVFPLTAKSSPAAPDATNNFRINALDFGVVADDESVDNTAALNRALEAAGQAGGAVVELPSGRFRFDGTLTLPAGVTLQGTYRVPPSVVNKDEKPTGTTLLTYANRGNPEGEPFINLKGSNSAVSGLVITYPEWKPSDVPPVPYPPCIASRETCNVVVENCCLLNPYEGINFVLAHRHLVRNVTGYPIWRGLFVDECYDIGHIENIHFWPFGVTYKADDPFCEWINVNGTAFEFARTDWHYVSNTFCFGYGRGYYFSDHGHGGTNGNFLGIGADSCRRAVLVEQSQKQGLLITNGEFVGRWTSEDSVCLETGDENDGAVMLTNCSFWGPIKTCVESRCRTGRLTLNACEFVDWDVAQSTRTRESAPAIAILAGRATIQGCSFEQGGVHLLIGEDAIHTTAVGNQAPGGFRIEGDKSPLKLQTAANEPNPFEVCPDGKENYSVRIGDGGDSRFVRYWHGPEKAPKTTFRWSSDESRVLLPLPQELRPVEIEMELDVPPEALGLESGEKSSQEKDDVGSEKVGIFDGDRKLASLHPGLNNVSFVLEPTLDDVNQDFELTLFVRCVGWRPCDVRDDSRDERLLGVQLNQVRVKTVGTQVEKTFDANFGVWAQ